MVVSKKAASLSVSINGNTFASRAEVEAYIAKLEAEAEAQIEAQEAVFSPVSITFESKSELHDVLAALGAYHDKKPRVCDSGTAPKFGLDAYTGNARATVRRVLPNILSGLGIVADTTQLNG
jgi:hypothetical protein